jgi:two-component system, NarL family, response regulator DesR
LDAQFLITIHRVGMALTGKKLPQRPTLRFDMQDAGSDDRSVVNAAEHAQGELFAAADGGPDRTRTAVLIEHTAARNRVSALVEAAPELLLLRLPEVHASPVPDGTDVAIVLLDEIGQVPPLPPGPLMVVITEGDSDAAIGQALDAGARAAVPEAMAPALVASTVRRVHLGDCPILGEIAIRPALAASVLERLAVAVSGGDAAVGPSDNPLTDRDRLILSAVADGESSEQIATRLNLSGQTVRNYVTTLLHKTGTRTRSQAAALAVKHGWLDI